MADETQETPTPRVADLRRAILEQLGQTVDARAAILAGVVYGDAASAGLTPAGTPQIADLARALESIDRVRVAEIQTGASATNFDLQAAAVELWNASQAAGGSTEVGDAVVAKLNEIAGAS